MEIVDAAYQTKSAVLFIVFNRPGNTNQVFAKIKKGKPKRLYIAADGPRKGHPDEDILCKQTRMIIDDINWDCEVKTLFRNENLGCKEAVSSAITWFFDNEDEGIILEDDCLPADSFFRFCDTLLERYRDDSRVGIISGCNLQHGKTWGTGSYYFSHMTHIWGWASWRRVWNGYNKDLKRFGEKAIRAQLEKVFDDNFIVDTWIQIFLDLKAGKIDTWDYQLGLTNFFHNSLSIIPNSNLISNIGFGSDSTHTGDADSINANIPLKEIGEIIHPAFFIVEKQADLYTLHQDFDIEKKRAKHNLRRRKMKRWAKSLFRSKN